MLKMYFGDPSQLGSGAQVLKVSQRINLVKFKAEIPLKSNLVKFKAKISISLTFVSKHFESSFFLSHASCVAFSLRKKLHLQLSATA